jgi:protein TonB
MNYLVEIGEPVETVRPTRHILDYIRVKDDSPVELIDQWPKPLPKPVATPSPEPPADPLGPNTRIGVRSKAAPPGGPTTKITQWGLTDSALINIINAQPHYPVRASQQGIEGHVVVSFDVTEMGTVENVSVIETTNGLFNKAAIEAAYRSRYKPKTVDGTPQVTRGLQKLFTFRMEM